MGVDQGMTAFDVFVPVHLDLAAGDPPREASMPELHSREPQAGQEPPKEFVWPATDLPGIRVTD